MPAVAAAGVILTALQEREALVGAVMVVLREAIILARQDRPVPAAVAGLELI